jgi:hypothetical protein
MKDLCIMFRLSLNETTNATPMSTKLSKHVEHTLGLDHKEIHSENRKRSERQRTTKSFHDEFTIYL